MSSAKKTATRGGKRPLEPDRPPAAAASTSAAPASKRPRLAPGAADPLAGIAFEDRAGAGDDDPPAAASSDTPSVPTPPTSDPDDLPFAPSQFIRAELRAELAALHHPPPGPPDLPALPDPDADELGSTDGLEDHDPPHEAPETPQRPRLRPRFDNSGPVRRRLDNSSPPPFLRTRTLREIRDLGLIPHDALPDSSDPDEVSPRFDDSGPVRRRLDNSRPPATFRTRGLPDADLDPSDLDEDYVPDPAPAPAAPSAPAPSSRPPRTKKRAYFNPPLWPAGAQTPALYRQANAAAARGGPVTCLETEVTLAADDDCPIGSLWEQMRAHELSGDRPRGNSQLDRNDFLKACMRLGAMVEPEKMAALLGGEHRHEEYCCFALAAMLGILNVRQARKKIREDSSTQVRGKHSDVVVYADELYESADELIKSPDVSMQVEGGKTELQGAVVEVGEVPNDGDDAEEVDDEPIRPFEELKCALKSDESFANVMSYVQRTYLTDIMGKDSDSRVFEEFIAYATELGMTFEMPCSPWPILPESSMPKDVIEKINASIKPFESRRKWLTEPMPAPELGPGSCVRHGTAQLWRHSCNNFSAKDMARISLIQPNRLLDWLTYTTAETNIAKNETAFYRDQNPVVSIAPIPMLYLADLAADFSLKVLSVAACLVTQEPLDLEEVENPVISDDDIRYAAAQVTQGHEQHRSAFHVFAEPPTNDAGLAFPALWPELIMRPLSEGESVVLCDRVPVNSFRIPLNAVNEARVVLDSLRKRLRHIYYNKPKMFTVPDPISMMTSEEKSASQKAKMQWLEKYGYKRAAPRQGNAKDEAGDIGGHQNTGPAQSPVTSINSHAAPSPGLLGNVGNSAATASEHVRTNPSSGLGGGPSRLSTVERSGRPGVLPPKEEAVPEQANAESKPVTFNELGESIFDLNKTEFTVSVNIADLMKHVRGYDFLKDRRKAPSMQSREDKEIAEALVEKDLVDYLNGTKKAKIVPASTISYHRLGWICLHALGQNVTADDDHMLGYGSTAHYTNFGVCKTSEKLTMSREALDALVGLVDQLVRREAEILMDCAAHDDGRPWIDRADIILVNSIRKENYIYGDL